jgi:hypothetical protein
LRIGKNEVLEKPGQSLGDIQQKAPMLSALWRLELRQGAAKDVHEATTGV